MVYSIIVAMCDATRRVIRRKSECTHAHTLTRGICTDIMYTVNAHRKEEKVCKHKFSYTLRGGLLAGSRRMLGEAHIHYHYNETTA